MLRLVASGLADKEVASELGMSESTVKSHLAAIREGLGIDNRVRLTLWAIGQPGVFERRAVSREVRLPACLDEAA